MKHRWLWIVGTALSIFLVSQTGRGPEAHTGQSSDAQNKRGPYARIAFLRPHDGRTVDFEAGYIRRLQWHKQAGDTWVWYGWNISFGERQRWFVYATFGRSAASLDNPVSPAEDERDSILNVIPHCEFTGNGLYEYLSALSRGTGEPQPTARLEFTTVLRPAASAGQPVGSPRWEKRTGAPRRDRPFGREDDHRNSDSAANDESWPGGAGS